MTRHVRFLALVASTLAAAIAWADDRPPKPPDQGRAPSQPTGAWRPCPGSQDRLVTDLGVRGPVPLSEPDARAPFRDPAFGSCLVRITDRRLDFADGGDGAAGLRNEYSRVQSFNADGSLILVRGVDGSGYLYDATTLQPLSRLELEGADPRWDANSPNLLYTFAETRLVSVDVRTGAHATVHDFAVDFPGQQLAAVWTRYEGSSSLDGHLWGLMAEDESWETTAFLVYDQPADRVIAKRDMRGVPGVADVDNVTISPLGSYFLADFSDHYCERGTLGTDARPCGLMVYDHELKNGRGVLRVVGHADLALDANRREVLIFQDIDTDTISLLDLATGVVSPLLPIDFSRTAVGLHFSGRAVRRPGWAVVSTYNGGRSAPGSWMDDQVFLVELRQGGRVVRLAHTRSVYSEAVGQDYWAEPHASANQELTRILFTSNWGRTGTEDVEMFMISLPPDWTERLPRPE